TSIARSAAVIRSRKPKRKPRGYQISDNRYSAQLRCAGCVFSFLLSSFCFLLSSNRMPSRRDFLSLAGKSLGLAAFSSATIGSLLRNVQTATNTVAHLSPEEAATDEDY